MNNLRVNEASRSVALGDLLFGKYLLLRKGKRSYTLLRIDYRASEEHRLAERALRGKQRNRCRHRVAAGPKVRVEECVSRVQVRLPREEPRVFVREGQVEGPRTDPIRLGDVNGLLRGPARGNALIKPRKQDPGLRDHRHPVGQPYRLQAPGKDLDRVAAEELPDRAARGQEPGEGQVAHDPGHGPLVFNPVQS